MSADAVDLLTSLYALRSQAGAVRVHAERQHLLSVAARMANFQEEVSDEINKLQTEEAPARVPELTLPRSRYADE